MIEAVASFLQVLLSASGAIVGPDMGAATIWAVMLAAAVLVVILFAAGLTRSAQEARDRPAGAIDVSVAVTQSDPDAAGHPRARAPGIALSAA